MATRADLLRRYWDQMPEAIGRATELWLQREEGVEAASEELRRLLHTVKGEAHMLGAAEVGQLLQALEATATVTASPDLGDAVMNAFDALMMVAAGASTGDAQVEEVEQRLLHLCDELRETGEAESGQSIEPPANNGASDPSAEARRTSRPPKREAGSVLDPRAVTPMVNEALRLHRETGLLRSELREIRNMLRALLAEIDPHLPPRELAERIIKTLGYGADIERRMAHLDAQWSTSEFGLSQTLESLEDEVRRASMVSTDGLRTQAHRAARAAASSLGKRVDLGFRGAAYIDATIAKALGPALIHLVRNAVDHGIEPPELRGQRGKPTSGRLDVAIEQTGPTLTVRVRDDGGGVDLDRLRSKVSETDPDAAGLGEEALLQRILDHGLSTRDVVTDVSGHGVGLDVVARAVRSVGGTMRIASEFGFGTMFELELPTRLQADVAVPVEVGAVRMALPARAVVGVHRIRQIVDSPQGPQISVVLEEGTRLISLFDLSRLLGREEPIREEQPALLLASGAETFAVAVDAYDTPRAYSFANIEELPFASQVVRGVASTPDGHVAYLLDADALRASLTGRVAYTGPMTTARPRTPLVLVVEDAPVARELLIGILRSFQVRVIDASDGREGLERAIHERPDLILTDIEMPFLGGLDMVAELRRNDSLSEIPVVVLTTRTESEFRKRAESLGVRHFLSKQRFVEEDLRRIVNECLSN